MPHAVRLVGTVAGIGFFGLLLLSSAGALVAQAETPAPPWLGEIGLRLSVVYDDNLYFQDLGDLANRASLVLSLQPSFSFRILDPTGPDDDRLNLVYEPELVRYGESAEQGHETHRLFLAGGQRAAEVSWELRNELLVTSGNRLAQEWPSPLGLPRSPVIGGPEFRSRTANNEVKGRFSARYSLGSGWFVGPRSEWWASDFRTEQRANRIPDPRGAFYGNYVDRANFNAGVELGRRIAPNTRVKVGYLLGVQDQGSLVDSPWKYDNTYQVLLLGIEGEPSPRLSYSLEAGPDFRSYGSSIRPNEDPHPVEIYLNGRASWRTSHTRVSGLLRLFKFMPGGGGGAMAMRLGNVEVERDLASRLCLRGALNVYGGAVAPPDPRGTDWLLTATLGAAWRYSPSVELAFDYLYDRGVSEEDDFYETPVGTIPGPNGSGREYTRRLFTVSVNWTLRPGALP